MLSLLVRALGLRAAVPALIWALPLDRVLTTLTPTRASQAPRSDTLREIESVTDLITRRLPPTRAACLTRALMRYTLLRSSGHAATFNVGVRPGGRDGFEAHAWVTLDDAPIMERETLNYRSTFVWPDPSASPDAAARAKDSLVPPHAGTSA